MVFFDSSLDLYEVAPVLDIRTLGLGLRPGGFSGTGGLGLESLGVGH